MPKARPKVDAVRPAKCKCNAPVLVLAWILGSLGIWALVAGFAKQFTSAEPTAFNTTVLGFYFAGTLLVFLAKMAKHKSCNCCH